MPYLVLFLGRIAAWVAAAAAGAWAVSSYVATDTPMVQAFGVVALLLIALVAWLYAVAPRSLRPLLPLGPQGDDGRALRLARKVERPYRRQARKIAWDLVPALASAGLVPESGRAPRLIAIERRPIGFRLALEPTPAVPRDVIEQNVARLGTALGAKAAQVVGEESNLQAVVIQLTDTTPYEGTRLPSWAEAQR